MIYRKYKEYLILISIILLFSIPALIFRCANADETQYLQETLLLSELIKRGIWFGSYGVGLHGFLSKLPTALLFCITKPSITTATIINMIYATTSSILLFNFLRNNKKIINSKYSFYTSLMFICSFQFLITTPTLLKESFLILSIILFLNEFFYKKRYFMLGFILLIILDAKEYVFFVLTPIIILWTLVCCFNQTNKLIDKFKKLLIINIQLFTPSIIFIILMFTTNIIPLNPFIASILGLMENTIHSNYQLRHFGLNYATSNLMEEGSKNISQIISNTNWYYEKLFYPITIFTRYVAKIFYPRVFSLLSIPWPILLPSIYQSIIDAKKWWNNKQTSLLFLPLTFWIYILVYSLYTSIGRYLFPITPIILIFFTRFITLNKNKRKILLLTLLFTLIALSFENSQVFIKTFIYLSIILSIYYFKPKVIFIYISMITLFSSLYFLITGDQISLNIKFGKNFEYNQLTKYIEPDDLTYFNDTGNEQLLAYYNQSLFLNPEWQWPIKNFLPKKNMLKFLDEQTIFTYNWETIKEFKKFITNTKINKIIFVESTIINSQIPRQNQINILLNQDWLNLENIDTSLKNKVIYILSIKKREINQFEDSITISLNLNKDTGQKIGTIFSISNNEENFVGAGFVESFSSHMKDNNRILNFYIKENDDVKIEKVNTDNFTNTHSRLISTGKNLYLLDQPIEFDDTPSAKTYNDMSNSFDKTNETFNRFISINNKQLLFLPKKIIYDTNTIFESKNNISAYYKNNLFYIYNKTKNPNLLVCKWSYNEEKINTNNCKTIKIPYDGTIVPITYGELNDEIVFALNNGILLSINNKQQLKIINPESENKGQFYTIINYYDKLLLGHYPDGKLYSYDGIKLVIEKNNLPFLDGSQELQTLMIYRGDLYAGIWPWGEVWKFDKKWQLVKRLFTEPNLEDRSMAPYRKIIQNDNINTESNAWGQRITNLTPYRYSLFASTSNKGNPYNKNTDSFVKNIEEYGAVWEIKTNSQVSCSFEYKEKTQLNFIHINKMILIYQDDILICKLPLINNYENIFNKKQILIGNGIFGKFDGTIKLQ